MVDMDQGDMTTRKHVRMLGDVDMDRRSCEVWLGGYAEGQKQRRRNNY